ncbi:MATE family efflux transporter [Frisingicoccus sp.]|uniref:MATE family efflux transporter n=1 Tax=Frisingicoccus sp. TaxID=1918627 RepID=UPI002E791530|nr:MATE family efflux transporter [Frisingicoccus sp.]MEE0752196.1 MATE family efflux transporter [Frisingicoccus sp.]
MIKDLTEGNPQTVLWKFTIPMFISVIFQQLYNIADSVIAGKFAGENALAAVGASYPITMIFMAIAVGSNIGCSVVISQLFGAKEYGKMKTAVFTTLISSAVLSVALTAGGLLGSRGLMMMINTPENIFTDGALYLRIYLGGFLFLFLYNVATGIFTSLGDSKTPLYFLIGSSIGNIFLDIWFVAGFHWGVAGVAWATFLAQGAACVLALMTLAQRLKRVQTAEKYELFSGDMLKRISRIAVPSILQQSFISVGNIFIQSLVNSFGSSVIAGYSAAIKLNTFTITCFTTMGNGVSSFTAQNLGGGRIERVKKGFGAGIKMCLLAAIPFFIVFFIFGENMIQLFMSGDGGGTALETGKVFLRIVSPFYFVISVKLIGDGVLRGAGAMRLFMIATFTDLVLRVLLSYILAGIFGVTGIWMSWPIGWSIATVLTCVFYRQGRWAQKYIVQ